mmetsp:Transcript_21577/g.66955  ORF Transcript_21577/g.66955 Transcript_21577/m.66955 type:complete len:213 (+) Transcript_21577:523-1161(+)
MARGVLHRCRSVPACVVYNEVRPAAETDTGNRRVACGLRGSSVVGIVASGATRAPASFQCHRVLHGAGRGGCGCGSRYAAGGSIEGDAWWRGRNRRRGKAPVDLRRGRARQRRDTACVRRSVCVRRRVLMLMCVVGRGHPRRGMQKATWSENPKKNPKKKRTLIGGRRRRSRAFGDPSGGRRYLCRVRPAPATRRHTRRREENKKHSARNEP